MHRSCFKGVKSKRGADGNSDHFLVLVKLKVMISNQWKGRNKRTNSVKFDVDKLQDENILNKFQLGINYHYQL